MDRIVRISEELKREVSQIIQTEVKDPRLPPFVSVTDIDVTKDLKHAKAYVSIMGTAEEKAEAIKALQHAQGFIRREVGKRIRLHSTPEFHFHLDESIDTGFRISKLIDETMEQSRLAAEKNAERLAEEERAENDKSEG